MQNRVDPTGNIIDSSSRGTWMGNRGQLHDETTRILRPFRLKAWLTCVLEFKNRRRKIMSPGLYTELFFLDEATAFSAGHRPCRECRREDHQRFKMYWIKGNPEFHFDEQISIKEIDSKLHDERIDRAGYKVTYLDIIDNLPTGTFVLTGGKPYLVTANKLFRWTPSGYDRSIPIPRDEIITVLTPRSIVNTFRAGYMPQVDNSVVGNAAG